MVIIELVGYLAVGLNILGNLLLTSKSARGWYIRITSNVAQLIYALCIASWPITSNALIFMPINLLGLYRWHKLNEGHLPECRTLRFRTCNCNRFQ